MNLNINRLSLQRKLSIFAEKQSGLIIGDPGVGKTHSLKLLRASLLKKEVLVRFFPIDRLATIDKRTILGQLNLGEDWIDVLRGQVEQVASRRGVLIFDSFDSIRNDEKRKVWINLIREALIGLRGSSWTILVSCRTYDAKKSLSLTDLFRSENSENFIFVIPHLDSEELEITLLENLKLRAAYVATNEHVRKLFSIPFYLLLINELQNKAESKDAFLKVMTTAQLIRLVFDRRLSEHENQRILVMLIKDLTKKQVEEHSLSTDWTSLPRWGGKEVDELFSTKLVENVTGFRSVRFSHNIFFDFAASEYFFPLEYKEFTRFMDSNPAHQMFLRPSLQFYVSDLFETRNTEYWSMLRHLNLLKNSKLTAFSKVVVPNIAVLECSDKEKVSYLNVLLEEKSDNSIEICSDILRALKSETSWLDDVYKIQIWCDFVLACSLRLNEKYAWNVGFISDAILKSKNCNLDLRKSISTVGRSLLSWSLETKKANPVNWSYGICAAWGVPLTCSTYNEDAESARFLLGQVLDFVKESNFQIDCVYRLCEDTNITKIIRHDPDFACEIYEKIYGPVDPGTGVNNKGIVMTFSFDKGDEFGLCRYNLSSVFQQFLDLHPLKAMRACFCAVESLARNQHHRFALEKESFESQEEKFNFRGRRSGIIEDISHIWDQGAYPEDERDLLNQVDEYFRLREESLTDNQISEILDLYADRAKVAVLWRRLLEIGASNPKKIGIHLIELCLARPVLLCSDTTEQAEGLIRCIYEDLDTVTQGLLEKAILGVVNQEAGDEYIKEYLAYRQKRIIATIPFEKLQTDEAKSLRKRDEEETKEETSSGEEIESHHFRPRTRQDEIDSIKDSNLELWTTVKDIEEFKIEEGQDDENGANPWPNKLYLLLALFEKQIEGAVDLDPLVGKRIERVRIQGSMLLLNNWKLLNDEIKYFIRNIMLEASKSRYPEYSAKEHDNWDNASWSPAPRNDAAQKLPWLLLWKPDDSEVKTAIKKLAVDDVPSVRFLLGVEIWRIREKNLAFLCELLSVLITDRNAVVVDGVCTSIYNGISVPEIRPFVFQLNKRMENDFGDLKYHKDVVQMLVDIALRHFGDPPLEEFGLWKSDPIKYAPKIQKATERLTAYCEPVIDPALLEEAIKLQVDFTKLSLEAIISINQKGIAIDEDQKKNVQVIFRTVDHIVSRFYFSCNFDEKFDKKKHGDITSFEKVKFFNAGIPIFKVIAAFSGNENGFLPPSTAHHFMEMLRGGLENGADAKLILELAHAVAKGGAKLNYNLDSLAIAEVVKIVELIIADHRHEIQEDAQMSILLELLDIFAQAGWSEALRLIWRLDEVYR